MTTIKYTDRLSFGLAIATCALNTCALSPTNCTILPTIEERAAMKHEIANRIATVYGKLPRNEKSRVGTKGEGWTDTIQWKKAFSDEESPLSLTEQGIAGIIRFYGPLVEHAAITAITVDGPAPCAGTVQSLVDWAAKLTLEKRNASAPSA